MINTGSFLLRAHAVSRSPTRRAVQLRYCVMNPSTKTSSSTNVGSYKCVLSARRGTFTSYDPVSETIKPASSCRAAREYAIGAVAAAVCGARPPMLSRARTATSRLDFIGNTSLGLQPVANVSKQPTLYRMQTSRRAWALRAVAPLFILIINSEAVAVRDRSAHRVPLRRPSAALPIDILRPPRTYTPHCSATLRLDLFVCNRATRISSLPRWFSADRRPRNE
ncbi:hypothetical protein EVAR_9363_1 [Eumeta japonica]|uniref:Uncharacterized protein n=1 Tax=Eumeta variegata TaxID=151549 RepID=A0A4C1YVL2_EUMVA|nr:hypothetical protein EVAR_9363_1 [Eumeta japonica]